ncbi:MAG: hypothetical protein BGO95_08785 [Micrococcales bacterium 73-13]|nr:MAG: hypothetical protein BGO95_08785 [Micrococcales bacterium 73-13]
MVSAIDVGPLVALPDRNAVAAFRSQHRGEAGFAVARTIGPVMIMAFGLVFAGAGLAFGWPQGLIPIVVGVLAVAAGVVSLATGGRRWARMYRIAAFAAANGLAYYATGGGPAYPGAIFGRGSGRAIADHLYRAEGRTLDYGNYEYTTGSGKSRQTHRWWFLALRLDRALPHMVLDSKANNALFGSTSLPVAFARDQVLHLEGDFDRHFTLYCPKEYERDALYVFTPDLMAACIDEAGAFDLEIVDDWLFAYARGSLDMADPAVQQRVWRFIDTVGAKTVTQTDGYADEQAGGRAAFAANVVAPGGLRLRRSVPVAAIVVAAVVLGVFLLLRFLG